MATSCVRSPELPRPVVERTRFLATGPCLLGGAVVRPERWDHVYVFLASPQMSTFITGRILPMIGGYTVRCWRRVREQRTSGHPFAVGRSQRGGPVHPRLRTIRRGRPQPYPH